MLHMRRLRGLGSCVHVNKAIGFLNTPKLAFPLLRVGRRGDLCGQSLTKGFCLATSSPTAWARPGQPGLIINCIALTLVLFCSLSLFLSSPLFLSFLLSISPSLFHTLFFSLLACESVALTGCYFAVAAPPSSHTGTKRRDCPNQEGFWGIWTVGEGHRRCF
ncbi:hypothetical protein AALO_G00194480 [Alosa alosa]|uniref:Transmembrane protein n=1 Tax=Alosa alosa TaxID=278164 RepID=A0AAV6G645_9TELE|nr:hypothetical protein AALO_G00194480 [Alosa alosa]